MADQKKVADKADILGKSAEPVIPSVPEKETNPAKPVERFVRNVLPNDRVTLSDGTVVQFCRYVFSTDDEKLIAKIRAEAKQHHIVQ